MPVVSLKNVFFEHDKGNFETVSFKDFSLDIHENEIVGIVGASGCGKTTLLQLISAYLTPDDGDVVLDYQNTRLGVSFQESKLVPWLTVENNISLGREHEWGPDNSFEFGAQEVIEQLRLGNHLSKFPNELSGGLAERVSIARLIARAPTFLLMDEPATSVDFEHRTQIEDYIYSYIRARCASAAIVTHDIEQAVAISDRVIVLVSKECVGYEEISIPSSVRNLQPSVARLDVRTPQISKLVLKSYRSMVGDDKRQ